MEDLLMKTKKDQVICIEGESTTDLYKLVSGKLMICSRNNSMVTALAYLEPGDYFGEFSFFDGLERSADVIAVEPSTLIKIPDSALKAQFPDWLLKTAKSMTKKLRLMDQVIRNKGIKKQKTSVKPLSIEEQTYYYKLLKK
jgi:CRP-like cAMP-binding protein